MFIAGEGGVPETVGTINGRTAVVNNNDLVAAIAGGVASAMAEQNALSKQQNDYLRTIASKNTTVRVEPSASWGKFNRRSDEMYARNAGV